MNYVSIFNNIGVSAAESQDNYAKQLSDPVAEYYQTNFNIVYTNPSVMAAIRELYAFAVSEGFTFQTRDKKFFRPGAEFDAVFHKHWISFVHDVISFIAAQGYLLWAVAKSEDGDDYPIVCYPDMVTVVIERDQVTLAQKIVPSWVNPNMNNKHKIYIISTGLHCGYDRRYDISPVAECKESIRMSLYLHQYYQIALKNGSQPSVLLRSSLGDNESRMHGDSLPISTGVGERIMIYAQMAEKDGMNQTRVRNVVSEAKYGNSQLIEQVVRPIPPATRTRMYTQREITEDLQYIPYGMTPHEMSTNVQVQPDFMKARMELDAEVRAVFGMPPKTTHTGHVFTDTQAILSMSPIMKAWLTTISTVLTTVFKTMYSDTGVEMSPMNSDAKKNTSNISNQDDDDVKIVPVKLVLSDYDMCKSYTDQGGISEDRFNILHLTKTMGDDSKAKNAGSIIETDKMKE
jgi:hypothetical protein